MAKYAKNRNYVPPSTKGKTVLVRPSKDKDGMVKYIKLKTPPSIFERIGRKETWVPMP